MDIVQQKVECYTDSLSPQIEEINKKLKKHTNIWKNKEADITEQGLALAEIGKIEHQIKALKPKELGGLSPDKIIQFDPEEILMTLVDLIWVRGDEDQKKEDALLCQNGCRFDIKTGKKEEIKFDRSIPDWTSTFQINRKFYVCGGKAEINGKEERIADFFSVDYFGKSEDLQPMNHKRGALSLSGLSSQLIALGGWNEDNLKTCEKF